MQKLTFQPSRYCGDRTTEVNVETLSDGFYRVTLLFIPINRSDNRFLYSRTMTYEQLRYRGLTKLCACNYSGSVDTRRLHTALLDSFERQFSRSYPPYTISRVRLDSSCNPIDSTFRFNHQF